MSGPIIDTDVTVDIDSDSVELQDYLSETIQVKQEGQDHAGPRWARLFWLLCRHNQHVAEEPFNQELELEELSELDCFLEAAIVFNKFGVDFWGVILPAVDSYREQVATAWRNRSDG